MKKLIALLMVCSFAVSIVACGGGAQKEAETEEATEAPAAEPAPAPEADSTVQADSTGAQQ